MCVCVCVFCLDPSSHSGQDLPDLCLAYSGPNKYLNALMSLFKYCNVESLFWPKEYFVVCAVLRKEERNSQDHKLGPGLGAFIHDLVKEIWATLSLPLASCANYLWFSVVSSGDEGDRS